MVGLPLAVAERSLAPARSCVTRLHRDAHTFLFCKLLRFFISSIGVAGDSNPRIVGEDALDTFGHQIGTVGNRHLTGMLRVADANTAAVVNRDPTCATRGIEKRIEEGPIR